MKHVLSMELLKTTLAKKLNSASIWWWTTIIEITISSLTFFFLRRQSFIWTGKLVSNTPFAGLMKIHTGYKNTIHVDHKRQYMGWYNTICFNSWFDIVFSWYSNGKLFGRQNLVSTGWRTATFRCNCASFKTERPYSIVGHTVY